MEQQTYDFVTTDEECNTGGVLSKLLQESDCSNDIATTFGENSNKEFDRNRYIISENVSSRYNSSQRRKKKVSIVAINTDTKRILQEFLRRQLLQHSVQTSPRKYQRFVELDVTENTTSSQNSTEYNVSQCNLEIEGSIPFADEDDDFEMKKCESLPEDDFQKIGLEIHHGKSKSVPNQCRVEDEYVNYQLPKAVLTSPPPAPPGTPHSLSEYGSDDLMLHDVPYIGQHASSSCSPSKDLLDDANKTDANISNSTDTFESKLCNSGKRQDNQRPPKVPNFLSFPVQQHSQSKSPTLLSDVDQDHDVHLEIVHHSPSKTDSHHFVQEISGSVSSIDTENDQNYTQGRKKKSFIKKTKDKLQVLLNLRQKKNSVPVYRAETFQDEEGLEYNRYPKKPYENSKGFDNISEDVTDTFEPHDEVTVLEENHVHISKHIHQTHIGPDKDTVLRTEDSVGIIDIQNAKQKKHIEAQWNIKQSTETAGFMGKIRKLTKRDKKVKKKKLSNDHSQTGFAFDKGDGSRIKTFSGVETQMNPLQIDGITTGNIHSVKVVSKGVQRNSSQINITDHEGKLIKTLIFDGSKEENLPRNLSFDILQESCITEKKINDHGTVRVIRESMTEFDHMGLEENAGHKENEKQSTNMTEAEKEDMYVKVAERLAQIGDNIMIEKEFTHLYDDMGSTIAKVQKSSHNSEITKTEIEMGDEQRQLAGSLDLKIPVKQAVLHIASMHTYPQFRKAVHSMVGRDVGWSQLAAVFQLTNKAIQLVGAGGTLAVNIQEMSLRYIEDTFASWIVSQGGWDSMLSDSNESVPESE